MGREAKARKERREQRVAVRQRQAPPPEQMLAYVAQQKRLAAYEEAQRIDAERRVLAAAGWIFADG